ncbi:unnamed protein product [Prorocentrum cordatum]|uniref:Uncharacterized protein n=1 Tax=Prorocentrum cordatum TaxID=2364126 RepID=A0ABN9W450_9DINO|nr:unnamed protein product [Polarella glacialis]
MMTGAPIFCNALSIAISIGTSLKTNSSHNNGSPRLSCSLEVSSSMKSDAPILGSALEIIIPVGLTMKGGATRRSPDAIILSKPLKITSVMKKNIGTLQITLSISSSMQGDKITVLSISLKNSSSMRK